MNEINKEKDKILDTKELILKNIENKNNKYKKTDTTKKIEYKSEIIKIKRVVKVVKGGRKFSFSVLVIVGNMKGKFGYALGKANEIPTAAKKATRKAEKNMMNVFINKNGSIDFEIRTKKCASKIILLPASQGKGIIAGNTVKNVLAIAGYKNIYAKVHGSKNKHNLINVTFKALKKYMLLKKVFKLAGEN